MPNYINGKKRFCETKQGEMTIAQHFSELNGLWQELDYYKDIKPCHTADATSFISR